MCIGDTGQHLCAWGSLTYLGMTVGLAGGRLVVGRVRWSRSNMCLCVWQREKERGTKRLILNNYMLALRPTYFHNFSLLFWGEGFVLLCKHKVALGLCQRQDICWFVTWNWQSCVYPKQCHLIENENFNPPKRLSRLQWTHEYLETSGWLLSFA